MNDIKIHLKSIFAFFALTAFIAAPQLAEAKGKSERNKTIAQSRAHTDIYHDVNIAIEDGYLPTDVCVPGMGYHFVNPGLIGGELSELTPQVLLYADSEEGLILVGVEYIVPATDSIPTLFDGVEFDGMILDADENAYDTLHAWIWRNNKEGMFASHNPRIECPVE